MSKTYRIHPSIGVARVGDSTDSFYLAPLEIGGLPIECDDQGNPAIVDGKPQPVERFRDSEGKIRRQAARFRIFVYEDGSPDGRELDLPTDGVVRVEWSAHVANKKAAWWDFTELYGNTMTDYGGEKNSYEARGVPLRNAEVAGASRRQALITDPGPRTLTLDAANPASPRKVGFDADSVPKGYSHAHFPGAGRAPFPIDTLGEMMINDDGELVVLGGYGNAAGSGQITTFAGADDFWDDVSDGAIRARLIFTDDSGNPLELRAWVITGAPKVAPELVNISTLDDVIFDMAVRFKSLDPDIFDRQAHPASGGWNAEYVVDYERHIAPLFDRMDGYRWVSSAQAMSSFARPRFDPRDSGEGTAAQRRLLFAQFRRPEGFARPSQYNELVAGDPLDPDIPLMPLNSGTNSVLNTPPELEIQKFATLTATQYFMLQQWAEGKFVVERAERPRESSTGVVTYPRDRVDIGNSVGLPMSPGIEVTWNSWNPVIYDDIYPYEVLHEDADYFATGLSASRDETAGGGCQPGDMTKRMAIPWQADFFDCSVQEINYSEPEINKTVVEAIPMPPAFYTYWWPPQSPMFVTAGSWTQAEQRASAVSSGQPVQFNRGINSFTQMIKAWRYTGFLVNVTQGEALRREHPYFIERERRDDQFLQASVEVANMLISQTGDGNTYAQAWFLANPLLPQVPVPPTSLAAYEVNPWAPSYLGRNPEGDEGS